MPAPVRPLPYKIEPNALSVPKGIVDYYSAEEIDTLLAALPGGGGAVDLSDYATKEEVADALANIPAPDLAGLAKAEDLPVVYEQSAEPTGKDGDLWLRPMAASEEAQVAAAAMSKDALSTEIQRVISDQPKTLTEPEVRAIVRSMISGGSKEPPPDKDWSVLPFAQGTGLIEGKLTNGVLRLRGELTFTYTSGGTYTTVRNLPQGFPRPEVDCKAVVTGKENGVAFRFVSVTLNTAGNLQICATGGKITHVDFTGFTAYIGT